MRECQKCGKLLPCDADHFGGVPGGGRKFLCINCSRKPARTPEKPYIIRLARPGEPSKLCPACERNLPLSGFTNCKSTRDKLSNICSDCKYLHNTTGSCYIMKQTGEPLKMAHYTEKIINGRPVTVREVY